MRVSNQDLEGLLSDYNVHSPLFDKLALDLQDARQELEYLHKKLRNKFAVAALQGMLAHVGNTDTLEDIVERAVYAADQMIKQLASQTS